MNFAKKVLLVEEYGIVFLDKWEFLLKEILRSADNYSVGYYQTDFVDMFGWNIDKDTADMLVSLLREEGFRAEHTEDSDFYNIYWR